MASKELIQAIGNVQTAFSGLIVLAEINELDKDKAEKQCDAAIEDRDEAFKQKYEMNKWLTEEKKQSKMKDDVIAAKEKSAIARNNDTRTKQREMQTDIDDYKSQIENLNKKVQDLEGIVDERDRDIARLSQLLESNHIPIPPM